MKLRLKPRPLPLRSELDRRHPRPRAVIAVAIAATLVALAARWWSRNGTTFLGELAFRVETLHVYWTLVATPAERTAWTWILIALVALFILGAVLVHRFVWRGAFPDLVRLDPRASPAGRPERTGRLYRVRKFQDDATERVHYRHYYKHGNRWFPLFRFDYVDLERPAEPIQLGVSLIRCGRLERDPSGRVHHRIPNADPLGSHALATTFREREVVEDQDRKTSIVMPGPGMNPEVMRKKWASERLQTKWAAELEDDEQLDREIEEAMTRAERPERTT